MRVSVCLEAILIPEYLDFHFGYSVPRSIIARIYSALYCYSLKYPKRMRPEGLSVGPLPEEEYK